MAASGVAVTVLTPNGRRQTVKVSPNTPLLQVLEDVCQKHGFNPDEHGLKFQRNLIDLTLPMRFANLPNNAKLEMVTSSRKQAVADSQVRIALQTEDGSRLQGSFSCGQTLFEVVTHFPQISESKLCESGSTPVCVYMRDEVSGLEALKTTTLKSLGLTGGSAIVRFLLKGNKAQADDDSSEPMKTAAMPTTPVASEATASLPSQPDPAPSQPETQMSEMPVPNSSPQRPMDTETVSPPTLATDTLPGEQEVAPASQNAAQPKPPVAERERPEDDGETAGPSGQSTSSSAANAAPFIPFSGGGQRLGGPGGGAVGRSLSSSSSSSSLSALTAAVESPKAKKAKPSHISYTKCQSAANKPDVEMEEVEEFLEPIEREPLVYHLDSTSRHCEAYENLPDEFFEVTVDDIRKRFAQLKSQREILEEAPLMTKSLREAQMKEKMERYPKVVLRVQFPDRHVLQGFFRPLETVGALRCFVKKHLEDPHLSFYLFITPPKTILSNPSTTLFQADLFPGALVYFGSDVKTDVYMKRELLESSVSAVQANESIASCILPPPTPSSSSVASSELRNPSELLCADASGSVQDEQDPPAQAAKSSRSNPGKVPKWLKLPGKK